MTQNDPDALKSQYGIWIEDGRGLATTLSILSADETLYNYQFDITIKSTVREELTWYITNQIQITFEEPLCKLAQESIDKVAGHNTLSLSAILALTSASQSIADVKAIANLAFETDEETDCGQLDYSLIVEDSAYKSFLKLDRE